MIACIVHPKLRASAALLGLSLLACGGHTVSQPPPRAKAAEPKPQTKAEDAPAATGASTPPASPPPKEEPSAPPLGTVLIIGDSHAFGPFGRALHDQFAKVGRRV